MLRSVQRQKAAYLFLLPGVALFVTFVLLPLIYSLRISFYDWNIVNPAVSPFVELDNYVRALKDPIFRRAVLNTLAYAVITVPGQLLSCSTNSSGDGLSFGWPITCQSSPRG
jgi:ABC-type sugar transport system permease subunit